MQPETIVKTVIVHYSGQGIKELENFEYWKRKSESNGLKRLFAGFSQILWLSEIKKEFNPDITISCLSGCSTINVFSGGKDTKIGIFHAPHQQVKERGRLRYLSTWLTYLLCYPFLDYLFCVSEEVKHSLKSFFTIPQAKIRLVYNVHFSEDIEMLARNDLNPISDSEHFLSPVILYCGRLDENKAPERAIKAFYKTGLSSVYNLVLIGPDPNNMWPKLNNTIESLNLHNSVFYLGNKTNPYSYIARSRALISSSYSESLPGVIIESLILGVPVVTTNSSKGIWEIFSCKDQYNENLDEIFKCYCGVISSNLSSKDPKMYDKDIVNLARGIEYITKIKRPEIFIFEKEIEPAKVARKFIL